MNNKEDQLIAETLDLLERGHYYPDLGLTASLVIKHLLKQVDILSESRQMWIEKSFSAEVEKKPITFLAGLHPFSCICEKCMELKVEANYK